MKKILAALAATCALTVAAHAADMVAAPAAPAWFVKLGGTGTWFGTSIVSTTLGGPTSTSTTNNFTGTVELGRYINDNISVSFFGGYPPTSTLSVNGGTTVGTATAGSLILAGQYHFGNGAIRPYIGLGGAYNPVFSTSPSAPFTSLSVSSGFAPVAEIGVDVPLANNIGLFVDVKQELYTATVVAGTPLGTSTTQIAINPTLVTAGLSFNF